MKAPKSKVLKSSSYKVLKLQNFMFKSILQFIKPYFKLISKEIGEFFGFFFYYLKKKTLIFSYRFEKHKNILVKFFLMKRGRYNRPFLHIITMIVLFIGVMIAPFLADTLPIFSSKASVLDLRSDNASKQSILVGEEVFATVISAKPRDGVIMYRVEKGDTLSTIADKFDISEDTIKWQNNLKGEYLDIGQELEILPVSGIAHKVASGETVYSIAKKYNTEAQSIVDFPFNEFAGNGESFALVSGQMLIVPNGIKPSEQPFIKRQVYIAQGPVPVSPGGFTFPLRGGLSQLYVWYHPGIDITADIGTPIVAAHNGTVTQVLVGGWDGGYGTNLYISNGDGIVSHYAHMSGVNVSVGQRVTGGSSVIGWVGMTGRTTGPHVHFEIQRNGSYVNPLSYVQ